MIALRQLIPSTINIIHQPFSEIWHDCTIGPANFSFSDINISFWHSVNNNLL